METAWDLHQIALRNGTNVAEPFPDNFLDPASPLIVLGPSQAFYQELLPDFACLPARKESSALAQLGRSFGATIKSWVQAVWHRDELEEPPANATSAENNSSVILLLRLGERDLLFTGDAGVEALTHAADRAAALGIDLRSCHFLREQTRDPKMFPIVYEENVNYGFRRNLLGLKPTGAAIAVVGSLAAIAAYTF